jgi:hypothetical protein
MKQETGAMSGKEEDKKTHELEVVKRAVKISIRLRGVSDWASWSWAPFKTKEETSKAQPSEKKKWQYACRLFGTNSLKEGAM